MKIIDRKMAGLIKEMFEKEFLNNIARKTKFIQMESTFTAESFISLCLFYKDSICKSSLSELSTTLESEDQMNISPQALHERFNSYSVEFLENILREALIRQNKVLSIKQNKIERLFNRINVVDATSFKISDNLKGFYKGTGGHSASAAVNIQLQYDILSGKIFACDVGKGASSDADYVYEIQKTVQPNDLVLKDLGYFKMDNLNFIDKAQAYYISKVKKHTITYINDEKNAPK